MSNDRSGAVENEKNIEKSTNFLTGGTSVSSNHSVEQGEQVQHSNDGLTTKELALSSILNQSTDTGIYGHMNDQGESNVPTGDQSSGTSGDETNHTQLRRQQELAQSETTENHNHCWSAVRHVQKKAGFIVDHPTTQWIIIILIASNAIMMGLATFDFVKENETAASAFSITDTVFLVLFTVELCLQFLCHGWYLFTDAWLVFDLVIVVTSWLLSEWQIIRALRIFRALRLITRIKVMQNLVVALFGVMPRMFAIWLLLCLVSYIFAVMFTQLFKDLYEQGATGDIDYFGRLDKTLFTLFQIMTLDAWADIARDVMVVHPWSWIPIIAYVIITGFVVVNLVIAVICDAVAALHDDDKAKLHGQAVPSASESNDDSRQRTVIIAPPLSMRDQLTALEHNVDKLSQQQETTLQTVLAITQQLVQANQRMKKKTTSSTSHST